MSFVTTQPEALADAAGRLQTLGSAMAAESAAVASPTTGVMPAAADEVSALQAAIFGAYGSLYQSVNAQATAIHELFVHTLGASAGSYAATESANSGATASPLSGGIAGLFGAATSAQSTEVPGANVANLLNIAGGNWGSASSDLLDMAQGSMMPAANEATGTADIAAAAPAGVDGTVLTGAVAPAGAAAPAGVAASAGAAGFGGIPMVPALGQAASVGGLSVPPSWAAGAAPAASPGAVTTAGWTAPAAQSTPVTTMPAAMPAMATTGKAAGFGAPRYGVKPTVMGRPAVV